MISVCMATYNGCKYIKEQLESILCQLSCDDEIIISDDNSTDNTLNIIKEINDSRIKIISFKRDKSNMQPIQLVTTNFENALNYAKGDLIFLADQDDVWLPNKVKIMSKYLEEYDYVVSDCYITDANLNIKHNTRFYKGSHFTRNRWMALILPTPYQGSCAAFRRCVLNRSIPFPKGIQSHDRWIGYIASFFYSYIIIPDSLILYRRHEYNTSTATERNRSSILMKLKARIRYIYALLKKYVDTRISL